MKKVLKGVKRVFSASSSSRSSASRSHDSMSQDSSRPSSFVPSQHGAAQSSYNPAHVGEPMVEDDDIIPIRNAEELERFESLRVREFAHTRIYDVSLLDRVGMDIELPTILRSIGWGKLYDEPRLDIKALHADSDQPAPLVTKAPGCGSPLGVFS